MTTIAYRDGVLASDSASGRGDYMAAGSVQKLFRTRDGVAGITGTAAIAKPLLDWLLATEVPADPAPIMNEKISVIHIRRDGVIELHEDGGVIYPAFEFMAWGSGMPGALGALYAGRSAVEAVAIAMKIDPWTGGEIQTLKLNEEK